MLFASAFLDGAFFAWVAAAALVFDPVGPVALSFC